MKSINVIADKKILGRWIYLSSLEDYVFSPNHGVFLNEYEMRRCIRRIDLARSKGDI